jgi:BirA family transcriptional regulator, biotin operon repressor / biotin---[acetyl-CoA-carboxylase] ligase
LPQSDKVRLIGKRRYLLEEITSTNDEARRLILAGEREGTAIIAASQTKGRGRQDRKWISPTGGIYLSVILRPYMNINKLHLITLMAAVACARTLKGLTKLDVSVKWPNDIMVDGKKAGGILCETVKGAVIVGIGINLNTNLAVMPTSLKKQVTSIKFESGTAFNKDKVTDILLEELDVLYSRLLGHHEDEILAEWSGFCNMLGSEVIIETATSKIEGKAESVGGRGELLLRTFNGKIRKIFSADAVKVKIEGK